MQILIPILVLLAASPAAADCTTTRIGSYSYYNCDDGRSGTSTHIGNYTYYSGNDGSSGTSTRIGQFEYYHDATPPRSDRPLIEPSSTGRYDAPYRSRSWYEEE